MIANSWDCALTIKESQGDLFSISRTLTTEIQNMHAIKINKLVKYWNRVNVNQRQCHTGVMLTLSLGPIKLNCSVEGLCSFLDKVSGNSPKTGAHSRGSWNSRNCRSSSIGGLSEKIGRNYIKWYHFGDLHKTITHLLVKKTMHSHLR